MKIRHSVVQIYWRCVCILSFSHLLRVVCWIYCFDFLLLCFMGIQNHPFVLQLNIVDVVCYCYMVACTFVKIWRRLHFICPLFPLLLNWLYFFLYFFLLFLKGFLCFLYTLIFLLLLLRHIRNSHLRVRLLNRLCILRFTLKV